MDKETEVTSSFGDVSTAPAPAKPEGGEDHGRKADKTQRMTKVKMIADMVRYMQDMPAASVKAVYKSCKAEKENGMTEYAPKMQEGHKITTADINVAEDISALFSGDELTEEFKTKATDIFETAVVSKVNEISESIHALHESGMQEIKEDLEIRLNDYLDYVIENWMKDNTLAVDSGIRSEIAEDFIGGLKNLFIENYIDIPEDKIDVVEELAKENESLKENLDAEMHKNIELVNENDSFRKEITIAEMADELAMVDREKFYDLAEGVEFESESKFRGRLETIREKYFSKIDEQVTSADPDTSDDSPIHINEVADHSDVTVKAIAESMSKLVR